MGIRGIVYDVGFRPYARYHSLARVIGVRKVWEWVFTVLSVVFAIGLTVWLVTMLSWAVTVWILQHW